jgi:hypothetical protein
MFAVIQKWIFKKMDLKRGGGQGQVSGSCECGKKLPDSIKCGGFFE